MGKSANDILKKLKNKKKDTSERTAYKDEIEKIWRKIYLREDGVVGGNRLRNSWPDCTWKGMKPIEQLTCAFFAAGALLDGPHNKSNTNLQGMLPVAYPELFPSNGNDPEKF